MDPVTTTHWVHDLSPFFFRFGESFGLRYYGLAYLLGFLGGGWLLHRYAITGRTTLRSEVISDLLFGLVAGVYIGGRVGYFLLYAPADLLAHPLLLFKVWEGGMASHGGFAGVAGALAWFARRHHISFFHLSDLVASVTALGLLLGRLANFINGELWGKVSTVPWAVIFPASESPGTPLDLIAPRHPSQLYAAALEGAVLLAYAQWRLWCTPVLRPHPGRLAGEFLIGYALMRIITEIFREPDPGVSPILDLSRGTFFSFFILIGGLAFYLRPSRSLISAGPPPARPPQS